MEELDKKYTDGSKLFSLNWGVKFCEAWRTNNLENVKDYAALGQVTFVLLDESSSELNLSLSWDGTGQPSIAGFRNDSPKFLSSIAGWSKFIEGDISPIMAVVSKLILYQGPISFAFGQGQKFEVIRKIARLIQHR